MGNHNRIVINCSGPVIHITLSPAGFTESSLVIEGTGGMFDVSYDVDLMCDDTKGIFCLQFCCREDGEANSQITLPTKQPFYLLQVSQTCLNCKRENLVRPTKGNSRVIL